jgi:hypothetical protein
MSEAMIAALITLGVKLEPDIQALFVKIFHHPNKPAAVKAASAAVDATPNGTLMEDTTEAGS